MIQFEVRGHPEPQGSTRAFIPKGWSRAVVTSDNPKMKSWRRNVAMEAMVAVSAYKGHPLPFAKDIPVYVHVIFFFRRPANMRQGASECKATRPDVDKLIRGVLDSMTGIVYADDAQVAKITAEKIYHSWEGALIGVMPSWA